MIKNNAQFKQILIFTIGMIIFISAGTGGWIKLHYGFNFIDEGYHMTESWRTTVGDDFLKDKTSTSIMQYTQINSIIFKLFPDITLLEFRKIQYCLTMASILIISWAMFLLNRQFWILPYIFSLFAFTGLDPTGMISNLSYYTYPHFFLTLHVSFLLFGLYLQKTHIKHILFFASGLCLWGISFSMLHLSGIIAAPFIIFAVSHYSNFQYFKFTKKDLLYIVLPFCLCWLVFLSIYNLRYIFALKESIGYHFALSTHGNFSDIHLEPLKYIFLCLLFLLAGINIFKINQFAIAAILLTGLSILMYFTIDTSLFSLIAPYYRGWFGRPMWFSAFLMSVIIVFSTKIVIKKFIKTNLSKNEELGIIILIPSTILCASFVFFSGLGPLTVLHCSIPIIAALCFFVLNQNKSHVAKFLVLIFLLTPFYITTAWADWQFTYFDVIPKQANAVINSGFGQGIKTNDIYEKLYNWIELTSQKYSSENDYMITYVVSPMAYMIAKRRPSLDNTFTDLKISSRNINDLVKKMISKNRQPAIAYAFERMPVLIPKSLGKGEYGMPKKQFDFIRSMDPISQYIKQNMELVAEFKIADDYLIRFFVDKKKMIPPDGNILKDN